MLSFVKQTAQNMQQQNRMTANTYGYFFQEDTAQVSILPTFIKFSQLMTGGEQVQLTYSLKWNQLLPWPCIVHKELCH